MTDEPQPIDDGADGADEQPESLDLERGQRIRRARDALGLTQAELARRYGIEPSSGRVSKWETEGAKPGNLPKLAAVLNVTVDHIEHGADLPAPMPDPTALQHLADQISQLQAEVRELQDFQATIAGLEGLQQRDEEPPPTPDPPDEPQP